MAKSKSLYDIHPGVDMIRKWAEDLPEKTGRTLDQWAESFRANAKNHPSRKDLCAKMMNEYGLGTNSAWHIYEYTFESLTWDGDPKVYLANAATYVENQFEGQKAHFRPLFDAIVAYARSLGKDVKICPCKTIIPIYRSRVFAEMKPATKARFELALRLDDTPFDSLIQANSRAKGNDRLRHVIIMQSIKDFTEPVKKWLKYAYMNELKK